MTSDPVASDPVPRWTFLTHHAQVLLVVAGDPDVLVADLAERVGVSRRAALTILAELEAAGYLDRTRVGRRTHYEVRRHRPLRHPDHRGHEVDELLAIFGAAADARPGPDPGPGAVG